MSDFHDIYKNNFWAVYNKNFRSTQGSLSFDTTSNINTEHSLKPTVNIWGASYLWVPEHFTPVNQTKPLTIPTIMSSCLY